MTINRKIDFGLTEDVILYSTGENGLLYFFSKNYDGKSGVFSLNVNTFETLLIQETDNFNYLGVLNSQIIFGYKINDEYCVNAGSNLIFKPDVVSLPQSQHFVATENFLRCKIQKGTTGNIETEIHQINKDFTYKISPKISGVIQFFPTKSDTVYFDDGLEAIEKHILQYLDMVSGTIDSVKIDARLNIFPYAISYQFDQYAVIYNKTIGQELVRFRNDSLVLLADLNKGPANGVKRPWLMANYSFSRFSNVNISHINDSFYLEMSNGNDSLDYVYRIFGDQIECITNLDKLNNIEYIYNGKIYNLILKRLLNDYEHNLYSLDLSNRIIQPTKRFSSEKNWYKHFNLLQRRQFVKPTFQTFGAVFNLMLDSEDNVFAHFATENYFFITPTDSFQESEIVSDNIVKLNKYGEYQWTCQIGSLYPGLLTTSNHHRMEIDHNGDVLVCGYIVRDGIIGQDTIRHKDDSDRVRFFLAKVDGKTGEVLWRKTLLIAQYTNSIYLDHLNVDTDGNIYLSFIGSGRTFSFGTKVVHLEKSPSNLMTKFNKDGEMQWMEIMEVPWTDSYGHTVVQDFDKLSKKIITQQCQGGPNWGSSCKFRDWGYLTNSVSPAGKTESVLPFYSDDLGWYRTGSVDANGRLHSFGIWRGSINFSAFYDQQNTRFVKDCHNLESFYKILNPNSGLIVRLFRTTDKNFFPAESKFYGGFIYLLATVDGGARLFKFSQNGDYMGSKPLNLALPFNQKEIRFKFAIKDERFVIAGFRIHNHKVLGIPQHNDVAYTVVKISEDGWEKDDVWYDEIEPLKKQKGRNLLYIFPNPANNFIKVVTTLDFENTQYEIYSVTGQLMQKGNFNSTSQIDISSLHRGPYILRFTSGDFIETGKFIKF